jgi:hypothetical protein
MVQSFLKKRELMHFRAPVVSAKIKTNERTILNTGVQSDDESDGGLEIVGIVP